MITTENGNKQKSYEEFKDEVKKISPVINEEDCKEVYKELTYYLIYEIEEMTPGHYDWAYNDAIKCIKKEYRHLFKVLCVNLGYDAPLGSLVPQDMPYKLILVNTESGDMITVDTLYRKLKERKQEGANGKQ